MTGGEVPGYLFNPQTDELLDGGQLTEGMWVLEAEPYMRGGLVSQHEEERLRAQRFRRVIRLTHEPPSADLPKGTIHFIGAWVDGYQKEHRYGLRQMWIVKKDSIPGATAGEQAHQFTWDEAQARAWLEPLVSAYAAHEAFWAGDGEEPAAELSRQAQKLEIGRDWIPAFVGGEDSVAWLVRYAQDEGIISAPAVPPFPGRERGLAGNEWNLSVEWGSSEHSGGYWFRITAGETIRLVTGTREWRELGQPDATGVDAAVAVLAEAVRSVNEVLAGLDEYARAQAGTTRGEITGE